jgi:3-hydroxyacyl-CoA dehydrogenase/3-hydroxy-2-methylbutyryl-CoA dehydrogenase
MEIAGRVAVVTGGASGLGQATALDLARAGARVVILDRDGQAARRAAAGIRASAGHAAEVGPVQADVSDEDSVARAFAQVADTHGALHICVSAAGVATPGKVLRRGQPLPLADFRRVIEINLVGLFDVLRQASALMVRNEPAEPDGERGVIINVSSGAAWQGQRGQAAYAASKAGVIGLMLPAARDLAEHGIRVVTIAPGLFRTAMAAGLPEHVVAGLEQMALYPRRLGDPAEFAGLAGHIIRNRFINATTMALDAGMRMV